MNENETTPFAKSFVWVAWLLALGLLAFVFQDVLNSQYNPNQDPEISLQQNGKAQVKLNQNRQGHYVTNGAINATEVTFLLDTGATNVSIPAHIAEQLSLKAEGQQRVNTANGTITVYRTTLNELRIGNIFLYNVSANINPKMKSNEILLGMSALKRVEFRQTGKQLILREQL